MESLFETNFANNQPLRKYEPLIRFDIDGNPQPRRPYNGIQPKFDGKVDVKKVSEPSMPKAVSNPEATKPRQQEELKRKVSPSSGASGPEPKKKQQTQTKIMSFFTKKT